MRSLDSARTCARLMRRCTLLTPSTQPSWGRMSSSQMIVHLSGAFRMVLGEIASSIPPTPSLFNSCVARYLVLAAPIRWPRNVPTVATLDVARQPPPPPELFEQLRADLLSTLRDFRITPAADLLPSHPFLGPLTRQQWMRWGYRHTDHHLRQFRC